MVSKSTSSIAMIHVDIKHIDAASTKEAAKKHFGSLPSNAVHIYMLSNPAEIIEPLTTAIYILFFC
ncbi:hypothetical protein FB551_1824 [Chryseobacterium aquifrigidense]|uniref:Uncharacterized protein n=1 Tax=Chryseobacterium aquifrigidense TaxID=558021 RepID=A0A543EKL0_9FLAO|nr:hypothetical protein FB551_1824 [Chryseobacterium aquifrigidense]